MNARYAIGIDLGTTNSVVAYVPLESQGSGDTCVDIRILKIPQLVGPGEVDVREALPSFLYLPRPGDVAALDLPGFDNPGHRVAGIYARAQSAMNPQRVVAAAKSWLCYNRAGREEPLLPWQAPDEIEKVSAVQCSESYLQHLIYAWQSQFPADAFRDQKVVLTVPASFDPAARDLTHRAAIAAGFPADFVLLEEPQAAVYRWLAAQGDHWRRTLSEGQTLLVVDIGGGTTDLTLIGVDRIDGDLALRRIAVGNHLLLGGDNMDLALAHMVAGQMQSMGHDLDPWQNVSLWHACRNAKEQLLKAGAPDTYTISILGRGSSLIGGTISAEVRRADIEQLVLGGFFPPCSSTDRPQRQPASGFQDIGLPYEADPAISKHIAAFLATQTVESRREGSHSTQPTHLLFNGGVLQSELLRERLTSAIASWCEKPPTVLGGPEDLDTAVAQGAAYYGWSKEQGGIRIRGGTARSYYVGIETAGLAIPGMPRPLRALCIAPQGMEEGTEVAVPSEEIGIVVGQPAKFRFFVSSQRPEDTVGRKLDRWSSDELVESNAIELNLSTDEDPTVPYVPVKFLSRVTELGMFELWCKSTRNDQQWKLEFNIREPEV